jgi:ribonuclease HI
VTVILYVDGGTRGMVICLVDPQKRKTIVKTRKRATTNNDLEYLAIIYGLEYINKYYPRDHVILKSDSMLAVKQINHKWKINGANLAVLNRKALNKQGKLVKIAWCPRENNLAGIHLEDIKDSLKGK